MFGLCVRRLLAKFVSSKDVRERTQSVNLLYCESPNLRISSGRGIHCLRIPKCLEESIKQKM